MSTMNVGLEKLVVAALLCAGATMACGEPQCPSGYVKKSDTCYRNRDGGSQTTSEAMGDDSPNEAGGHDGSNDDAEAAGADIGTPPVDTGAPPIDGGVPLADATSIGTTLPLADATSVDTAVPPADATPGVDAAPLADAALPVDASGEQDSGQVDAGIVTCASQPCQNGGSCTDMPGGFRCSCSAPFMGDRCEAKVCPTVFLRTAEDLANAQTCGVIQGDLNVASAGIASVTATDLPHLRKVTGNLNVSSMLNNGVESPRLETLTLATLREVDGSVVIVFTGPDSVREIRLPALTRVGMGVNFGLTDTRLLDLSALTAVQGSFFISQLYYLCSLYVGRIETITASVQISALYNLSASAIKPLLEAAANAPMASQIGCCAIGDNLDCVIFGVADRARCGC